MRMMLKAVIPTDSGNTAIQDGSLDKVIHRMLETIKPEAAYFITEEHGHRCCIAFFDLERVSDIVPIGEPLFMALNAQITWTPAMNAEDLQAGMAAAMNGMRHPVS